MKQFWHIQEIGRWRLFTFNGFEQSKYTQFFGFSFEFPALYAAASLA
jgi:hypothetical protein